MIVFYKKLISKCFKIPINNTN